MTRVSFDAKAALTGCADTVVRCLHSAGSDKFRPNSERMQATETRIPLSETSILHTFRKALRSFFNWKILRAGKQEKSGRFERSN